MTVHLGWAAGRTVERLRDDLGGAAGPIDLGAAEDPLASLQTAAAAAGADQPIVLVAPAARHLRSLVEAVRQGLPAAPRRRWTRAQVLDLVDQAGLDVAWCELAVDPGIGLPQRPLGMLRSVVLEGLDLGMLGLDDVEELAAEAIVVVARRRRPEPPALSIVITTCDQPALLERCLDALSAAPPTGSYEVVVVEGGPRASGVAVASARGHTVVSGPRTGWADAVGVGIRAARGSVVALLHDDARPRPGALDALVDELARRPGTGAVGPLLLRRDGKAWGAGYAHSPDLLPYLLHRGAAPDAPEVLGAGPVAGLPGACLVAHRRALLVAGGLDGDLGVFADADLCLRFAARGWPSRFCPTAVVDHDGGGTPGPRGIHDDVDAFLVRWGDVIQPDDDARCEPFGILAPLLRVRSWPIPRLGRTPVTDEPATLWTATIFDRSGYANEARLFLWALDAAGTPTYANPYRWPPPQVDLGLVRNARLQHMVHDELPVEAVHVAHLPALTLAPHPGAIANVARTMWETKELPAARAERCLEFDEVWLPKQAEVEVFAAAGVPRSKLVVVPAPIDDALYREEGPRGQIDGAVGRTFLSVFAWGRRKGWDVLLRAYVEEFRPHEAVTLVLAVSPTLVHPLSSVAEQLDELLRSHLGRSPDACPRIVVLPMVDATPVEVRELYRCADAFVLPTRGEGACLPVMEAMASGLPTITTRGAMGYLADDRNLLVDATPSPIERVGWQEFPEFRGHLWDEPDLAQLRSAMRRVADDLDGVQDLAQRGRAHILEHLSLDAIGRQAQARIRALAAR